MYFSRQQFNFCFCHSSGYLKTVLLIMKYLYFVFYLYGNTKGFFFIFVLLLVFFCRLLFCFFSMKSEQNQSCTESISYIQVSSSIIKDQIEVLSVWVSQPTLEGHLVAENGEAWPCSEAFLGCYCHHNGD